MTAKAAKPRRLFTDIETSPNIVLSWNIGRDLSIGHENIVRERAIICIGYKWQGEDEVHSLTWDSRQSDRSMLRQFASVLREADEVVAHNGDRFDWKWLRTRALFHGIAFPHDLKTVDTLKIAWAKFKFNNSRLDYIARFLGLGAKSATGYGLWKKVVMDKDETALSQMVEYCKNDVRILEAVYDKLVPAVKPHTHLGVFQGHAPWSCPTCASNDVKKSKTRVTPAGALQHQMRCTKGHYFTLSNTTFRQYVKARDLA